MVVLVIKDKLFTHIHCLTYHEQFCRTCHALRTPLIIMNVVIWSGEKAANTVNVIVGVLIWSLDVGQRLK